MNLRNISIALFCLIFGFNALAQNTITVISIKCESKINPVGVEAVKPHFSWIISASDREMEQSAYQILVSDSPERMKAGVGNIWDSKIVKSDLSVQVEYAGEPLKPEQKYFWKVRVWNQFGKESMWSAPGFWQTGLLSAENWGKAIWIGKENLADSMQVVPGVHGSGNDLGNKALRKSEVPKFRKVFSVDKQIKNATLSICGLGQYEAKLNGQEIGQSFLSPGWTDYSKSCLYNIYDVTAQLRRGKNALGVVVGNGFYNINRERYRKLVIAYGYPKLICKLKINYADKSSVTVVSDESWSCASSPITFSSIYGGEDFDATKDQKGWDLATFDDSDWSKVLAVDPPKGRLSAESDYPVMVGKSINAKRIHQLTPGRYLYDFGQNCSGIVGLKVSGKRGSVIKLIPGELITKQMEINQKASGDPYYYSYTLKGEGIESWKPKFSYYGFRYLMVEGAAPASEKLQTLLPQIQEIHLLHTSNSSPRVGEFSCSNELFNRIYTLIDWAIRSNIQSVVTDCPHREKLGWLEQTYLMGASMHYNYNLYSLYRKCIADMMEAQLPNGLVPDIAPEYVPFSGGFRDSPEWGSASVILPWMLWKWYGDHEIVEKAMPMMVKYVDYLGTKAEGHILSHGLGDWFDYGPKTPGEAQLTPKSLTATAIYYHDITLLVKMMELTGRPFDAKKLELLGDEVKSAFNAKFYNIEKNTYSTGSQTAMAMPLCFGLVDEKDKKAVTRELVKSITSSGKSLTAGDIGFHYLVKALEEGGASQLLFDMNFRDDVPGYGFQLKKGATALTESWPALEEVSNNHLMLGHIMEWFYSGLGGIKQDQTSIAFNRIIIKPQVVGDLTHVNCSYQSPYGIIKSEWIRENGSLEMKIEIPANTSAMIFFPTKERASVTESGEKIKVLLSPDGKYYGNVGSGSYTFKMSF